MTRTDIHRPSAPEFDPTDYECVDVFDLHPDAMQGRYRMEAVNRLMDAGYRRGGVHPMGQCSHCGAALRYTALMIHEPTKAYLWIGEQCLGNRFELESATKFHELRKAAALNRERAAKSDRIAALIAAHPVLADLTDEACASAYGDFVASVSYQLRRDGRLTERQIATIERIIPEQIERAHQAAIWEDQRREEAVTAQPAPAGRVVVTGEVLSIRDKETAYGRVWKMTVRAAQGFRVWVTVPAELDLDALPHGTWVRFTATLTPSDDDALFAFGKRPTKAEIIEAPSFA
jgi:hypothetical protein